MKNIFILSAFILLTFSCEKEETKPNDQIVDSTDVPAVIAKKIKTTLNSSLEGAVQEYDIEVYLPVSFETNKTLPVIYLLNGDPNKPGGSNEPGNIAGDQLLDKTINVTQTLNHDAIIVHIDTDDRNTYNWHNRGEGQNFYTFLTSDLIPFIDKTYKNNNASRTIIGHGVGSRYSLYIMLFREESENSFFQNFIISDPYGLRFLTEQLETDNFLQPKNKIKLYLSFSQQLLDISNTQDQSTLKPFANIIQFKQYPWLSISYKEFSGFDHITAIEPSFTAGLKFVLDLE